MIKNLIMPDHDKPPEKIVSLCPSVTETLCEIGLVGKIAGRTDYCIHPENLVKNIPKIGEVKNPDLNKIKAINPDLIIFVKDENKLADYELLSKEFNCLVFDVQNISDSVKMMETIGERLDNIKASYLAYRINLCIERKKGAAAWKRFLYLVWKEPYMAAGDKTYTGSLLSVFGMKNVLQSQEGYPEIDIQSINKEIDYVFLPDEPWKFTEKDRQEIGRIFPKSIIQLVEGDLFSWYGYRTLVALKYLPKHLQ